MAASSTTFIDQLKESQPADLGEDERRCRVETARALLEGQGEADLADEVDGTIVIGPDNERAIQRLVEDRLAEVLPPDVHEVFETTLDHLSVAKEAAEGDDVRTIDHEMARYVLADRIGQNFAMTTDEARNVAFSLMHSLAHTAEQTLIFQHMQDEGTEKKQWQIRSAEPYAEHRAADKEIRSTDDHFEIGGDTLLYPGDPSGSAGQVVNCTCVLHTPT